MNIFSPSHDTLAFSECSPCEKFSRNTSTPAKNNFSIISTELLAGPNVASCFVAFRQREFVGNNGTLLDLVFTSLNESYDGGVLTSVLVVVAVARPTINRFDATGRKALNAVNAEITDRRKKVITLFTCATPKHSKKAV